MGGELAEITAEPEDRRPLPANKALAGRVPVVPVFWIVVPGAFTGERAAWSRGLRAAAVIAALP